MSVLNTANDVRLGATGVDRVYYGSTQVWPTGFDPLVDINWYAAYFAEDPDWSPPADGDPVDQWDDGTGGGRHATASTTARPTYRASYAGLNGRPALEFDGTANTMVTSGIWAPGVTFTACVICKPDDTTATNRPILGRAGPTNINLNTTWTGGANPAMAAGTTLGSSYVTTSSGLLLAARYAGESSLIYANGTENSGDAGTNMWSSTNLPRISGNTLTPTTFFDGAVPFVGFYNGDLFADAAWPSFETWAATHYGITIS